MFRKGLQTIVLLALLVVFPLLSWLYLQRGLDYRISAMEEVQAKAHLPSQVDWIASPGIFIVYERPIFGTQLDPLRKQFQDRGDVLFHQIDYRTPPALTDSLHLVVQQLSSKRDVDMTELIFLINQEKGIVGAYDPRLESDLGMLVEHIVFLLPPEEQRDFEFKREKEK